MAEKVRLFFWELYCRVSNWNAERIRRLAGYGPPLLMYKKLAYELVEEGELCCLSLRSGHQMLLLAAVNYLADTRDRGAVPGLKKLFFKYVPGVSKYKGAESLFFADGVLTPLYGPNDYLPGVVQRQTMEVLLKLMTKEEAREFILKVLLSHKAHLYQVYFNDETLWKINEFALKNNLEEILSLLPQELAV